MRIIELDTKKPNLPKLDNQGNESIIYINGNTLYKIFNDDVNCQLKLDSLDFIEQNKSTLKGLIMPNEKLSFKESFVGHTMDIYDCKSIDNYFDYSIEFEKRHHYCLEYLDIFNRMNSIEAQHMDFHTDNLLIDKDGNALIGDCCSIKNKSIGIKYKQEQLVILMSLLTGVNLMSEVNSTICISEVINQIGSNSLLNYYYKPGNNLDFCLFEGFNNNVEAVKKIVKTYGEF